MLAPGNLWYTAKPWCSRIFTQIYNRYTTWCESKPVAAANQKSIFDAVKEAEMVCVCHIQTVTSRQTAFSRVTSNLSQVLHDLENISPRVLWQELLLTSVASAHHSMSIAGTGSANFLPPISLLRMHPCSSPLPVAAGAQLDCALSLLEAVASLCCRSASEPLLPALAWRSYRVAFARCR
jgi:hypothetical protein